MTIVFFSNVLNNHQVALCDELYEQNSKEFYFIETDTLIESRKVMGFKQFDRPYLIRLNNESNYEKAKELANAADIAIMGANSYQFLKIRLQKPKAITFSYSERWLKRGFKNIFSPNILKLILLYYRIGFKREWYILAAGGYLANDFKKLGIFQNRIFKWGYFPKYNFEITQHKIKDNTIKILWVGRFVNWKHPESMISLAKSLHVSDYHFSITMIGDGPEMESIRYELKTKSELREYISLLGNQPNDVVIEQMQQSHIFCFTSTRQEGWGAVLGEAMASGCCPVSSSEAGATPILIQPGINGLIFNTNNFNDLFDKVSYLIENPDQRMMMSKNAYETMKNYWNAKTAASEFLKLAKLKSINYESMPNQSLLPASPLYPYNYTPSKE